MDLILALVGFILLTLKKFNSANVRHTVHSYYKSDIITLCLLRNVISKYMSEEYIEKKKIFFFQFVSIAYGRHYFLKIDALAHDARDIDNMI